MLEEPKMASSYLQASQQILNPGNGLVPFEQSAIQELKLKYRDENGADVQELKYILRELLYYPSSQLAELHNITNRLGALDLKEIEKDIEEFKKIIKEVQTCPCCGYIQQRQTLGICTDIFQIKHLGVSTYLYFFTIKAIMVLLLCLFFMYAIYSIITNFEASQDYQKSINTNNTKLISYEGILSLSLGSKILHNSVKDKSYYYTQCWIGYGVMALWGILFLFIKRSQIISGRQIDKNAVTASDFTILIKNFPKEMSIYQFEKQINRYYQQKIRQTKNQNLYRMLKVVKINLVVPFYLQKSYFHDKRLEPMDEKIKQYRDIFVNWIIQRMQHQSFSNNLEERQRIINQYFDLLKQQDKTYNQIIIQIREKKQKLKGYNAVPAFITFNNSYVSQMIVSWHKNSDSYLNMCTSDEKQKQKYFYFKNQNNQFMERAQIKKAPQPEDVLFANFGQPAKKRIKKKLLSYTITFLILLLSFGAISGISLAQISYQKSVNVKDLNSKIISFLISLCISVFNIIIQQILRKLARWDRNQTRTDYQAGLGLKAVFASLANSIIIPILVNYILEGKNLYGRDGLAEDIFYLGITNAFLAPLLKIIDFQYLFLNLSKHYWNLPKSKLYLNQNQLNEKLSQLQFQVGYQYIHIVNLFLFTCFYVSFQPIIVVFSIAGLFFMYWAQKYTLFNRCQRPIPGNSYINFLMYQLVYFGPLAYSLGSFCWSHFFVQDQFINLAPNLVSIIFSFLIFMIPYKHFAKILFDLQKQQEHIYQKDRILMPSEYDRLNPQTSKKAIAQYLEYLYRLNSKKQSGQMNMTQQKILRNRFNIKFVKNKPRYVIQNQYKYLLKKLYEDYDMDINKNLLAIFNQFSNEQSKFNISNQKNQRLNESKQSRINNNKLIQTQIINILSSKNHQNISNGLLQSSFEKVQSVINSGVSKKQLSQSKQIKRKQVPKKLQKIISLQLTDSRIQQQDTRKYSKEERQRDPNVSNLKILKQKNSLNNQTSYLEAHQDVNILPSSDRLNRLSKAG